MNESGSLLMLVLPLLPAILMVFLEPPMEERARRLSRRNSRHAHRGSRRHSASVLHFSDRSLQVYVVAARIIGCLYFGAGISVFIRWIGGFEPISQIGLGDDTAWSDVIPSAIFVILGMLVVLSGDRVTAMVRKVNRERSLRRTHEEARRFYE